MIDIKDNQDYEVINPRTGQREIWSGERIRIYQIVYGGEIEPPKKSPKKKTSTTKKD